MYIIVVVTFGVVVLGPLLGLVMKDVAPPYYEAFVDLGDHLSLLAALASLLLWWMHESQKRDDEKKQRRRTARYWVLYNALNRCNQDLTTYYHLQRVVNGDAYKAFNVQVSADREDKPRKLDPGLLVAFTEVRFFLDGFSRTWTNDDVLSEALAFDFSLLTEEEKKKTLAYFENYNTMQDAVNFVLPFLGSHHEQMQSVSSAASPSITSHQAVHVVNSLQDIQESLHARIKDAWNIWQCIRDKSNDSFEEIEERFKVLESRARQVNIVF